MISRLKGIPALSVARDVALLPDPTCHHLQRRFMRERVWDVNLDADSYSLQNPRSPNARSWPEDMNEVGTPHTVRRMRELNHHLNIEEMRRMMKKRTFVMPQIHVGDLVEIKYEICRSDKTFAVFQGYCTELRNQAMSSCMVLKNTYDGIGVEQLVPIYNPRLLNVKLVKQVTVLPEQKKLDTRQKTRNYRYCWHRRFRGRHRWQGQRFSWWKIPNKVGILSMEPKLKLEMSHIRRRYQMQRNQAGLPPYIFPGPYHIHRRTTREVRAEMERRMRIYAWDDKRMRIAKLRRRRQKHSWNTYKIPRADPNKAAAVKDRLPGWHTLNNTEK